MSILFVTDNNIMVAARKRHTTYYSVGEEEKTPAQRDVYSAKHIFDNSDSVYNHVKDLVSALTFQSSISREDRDNLVTHIYEQIKVFSKDKLAYDNISNINKFIQKSVNEYLLKERYYG